jgi:cytochrome c-type biogenesis protein CcmH/NrfF
MSDGPRPADAVPSDEAGPERSGAQGRAREGASNEVPARRGARLVWITLAVVVVVVLAVSLWPRSGTPSVAERTRSLASELRCVDCEGLSVADSATRSARLVREDIAARLRRGQSVDEIRQYYVDQNGESILLKPSNRGIGIVVWALPVIALLLGAAGLVVALRRWQRQPRLVATDDDEDLVARARGEQEPGA